MAGSGIVTGHFNFSSLYYFLPKREECSLIPKEFCHSKLDNPQEVTKNITKKWCITRDQYEQLQSGERGLSPASAPIQINLDDVDLLGDIDIGDLAGVAINAQSPGNGSLAGLANQPAIHPRAYTKRDLNEETKKESNSTSIVDQVLTPSSVPKEHNNPERHEETTD